ncbi:glycosyltransferase [Micromonospora sp. WMMD558]|uniref:glycosyltransferase n=1 Tax=unclassified Micromonospora TaxID=2617518 RepID=UPI0012B48675|nr:glycosyltransferase [Micromonospora sp. WMMC415]QGN49362.1 glycosyl transferase family 28 [Micromonospora sp. WMMC415]
MSGDCEAAAPPVRPEAATRVPRQRDRAGATLTTVLVAVGTDKHPFDRLVGWLESWAPEVTDRVAFTVQHGHTRAPGVPGAVPFLGHEELQAAMSGADLVVCHGGPATILEARRHGRLPIVVPRDPARGEHVDDHQLLFARRLGAAGMVVLCETREALVEALAAGVADPGRFAVRADPDSAQAQETAVARVGEIVETLVAASSGRRTWWRPWTRPHRNGARR